MFLSPAVQSKGAVCVVSRWPIDACHSFYACETKFSKLEWVDKTTIGRFKLTF
mgnify:CR=1 FL=1